MFRLKNIFAILLMTFLTTKIQAEENYCDPLLCLETGGPHIACNNDGSFAASCSYDAEIIHMKSEIKNLLLDLHNSYRNQIASGEISHFPTASRMARMQWDKDLEYLAELNVKQCAVTYDTCHNTHKYMESGQNLGNMVYMDEYEVETFVTDVVQRWFEEEYVYAPMHAVERFVHRINWYKFEHFTIMVKDRADRIGCSISHQTIDHWRIFYLACNYARGNVQREPVYEIGPIASKCKTGIDNKYTALCSIDEDYRS